MRRVLQLSALLLFCANLAFGQHDPNDEVRSIILLARHGVRAPIESETRSGAYNAQPWPAWPVKPGVLTEHGASALRLLGDFYRSRYPSLFDHISCDDPGIYVEANSTQRTIASAKALLSGLVPDCSIKIHRTPVGQRNPLFSPPEDNPVINARWTDAINGRIADQPEWFTNAFAGTLEKLHRVLLNCETKRCDSARPDFRTVRGENGIVSSRNMREESPVKVGADFAENFLLEYTEGLSMEQVGWGRISRGDLDQLMEMNTRYHDFMLRTPYWAQVAASDLAARIRDTVLAAAEGKAVPGELGTPQDRVVLLDGHDSNLAWLGGLLRLDWILKDQTFNATPPGSGFVFEVHHNRRTGADSVRVFFVGQTLDQIRELRPLKGEERPSVAPVFIPGCSGPGPEYACPVDAFDRVVTRAIDPQFVEAGVR